MRLLIVRLSMEKRHVQIAFYGVLICMGLYVFLYRQTVSWEDMFVAFGTILLALATFQLAYSEVEESRKERRRLRLKEQLEGLYAPLMTDLDLFDENKSGISLMSTIEIIYNKIKLKYEYLALPNLREQIREFYRINYIVSTKKPIKPDLIAKFNKVCIIETKETIFNDYNSLLEEYNELTN